MKRRLLTTAAAISMVLCAAVLASWPSKDAVRLLKFPLLGRLTIGVEAGPDVTAWVREDHAVPRDIEIAESDPRAVEWLPWQYRQPGGRAGFIKWGSESLGDADGEGLYISAHEFGVLRWLTMPSWFAVAASAVLPAIWLTRKRRRIPLGCCRVCCYNLTGNTSGVCPECGTPTAPENSQARA